MHSAQILGRTRRADAASFDPLRLKAAISSGLLSFPVTFFDEEGEFRREDYSRSIEVAMRNGPSTLFAAGGTGEFFSIGLDEYQAVIEAAVEGAGGGVPIVAGCGYGTRIAV